MKVSFKKKLCLSFSYSDCNIWKYPRSDAEDSYPEFLGDFEINSLKHEQIFSTDGMTLKVVYTPGHTTDHCILFVDETKELFSGDCILGEGTAVFEDLYDYMKSLELIINENPSKIYPGHGNIVTVSTEQFCSLLRLKIKSLFLSFVVRLYRIQYQKSNTTSTIVINVKHKSLMCLSQIQKHGIRIWI